MGMFDEMRDKAENYAAENPDKVDQGIEKGGDFLDEKTGGRYSEQIDQGQQKASDYVEGLGGEQGDREERQQ